MDKEKSVSKNGNSAWVQVPSPAPQFPPHFEVMSAKQTQFRTLCVDVCGG
jgi:hypothetical protein